jgi:hypothetical protein
LRNRNAEVAELADARDSKSRGTWYHVGSTPTFGTMLRINKKSHYLRSVIDQVESILNVVQIDKSRVYRFIQKNN